VTDHENQLREAFETHEDQAPDPAAVYARVQELSKTYLWRRRGVQAAGGTVVAAGLIAGGLQLPHLLPGQTDGTNVANVAVGAAPAVSPTVTLPAAKPAVPKLSPAEALLQKYYDAYFNAGYDYDDAVALAKIWHKKGNIGSVKAEAGKKLLEGKKLPIKPGTAPTVPSVPPKEEKRVEAFFAAGYTYDDAVTLSKLWHTVDPYHAKIEGGKRLLAGQTLPIKP
jgi:hypothetical protein